MTRPQCVLGIRIFAIVALGLLAAYHALRLLATNCTGAGCDVYIPLSVLLPVVTLMMVAITGCWQSSQRDRDIKKEAVEPGYLC